MRLGTTVGGRYRLVKGPLKGGIGEVWLARDQRLPRDVILKRLRPADDTPTGFDRLEAEARALAPFSHPHVVTLHDVLTLPGDERAGGRRKSTSWLVMEYVSGGSLEDRPTMSPERAARVGAQIADALAALHAERLVHGDVKPGNVVVTRQGLAELADFGAAYRVGGKETITPNGAVSYTPDYAAPEVVQGQPEPASDVFSLGALLYDLVTGRSPRPGAGEDVDPYVAQRQAARGEVELAEDIGVLSDILPAVLDREPKNRPTATEARRLLEEVAGPQEPLPPAEPGRNTRTGPVPDVGEVLPPDDAPRSELRGRAAALVRSRLFLVATTAVLTLAVAFLVGRIIPDDREAQGDRTEAVPSAPGATGSAASQSKNAGSVIGDHRTADLCALSSTSVLKPFGEADLDRDYGNFDRCDVIVDTGEDEPVDVEVFFDTSGASELSPPKETTGVVDEADDGDACVKALLPAGDPDVNIMVVAKQDEGSAPLCDMAEAATEYAVQVLNRGELPRRSDQLPKTSLIHQDACTLLTADALEVIPGIDAGDPDIGFGNWDCKWHSTTNDLWAELRFDRGETPTAADGTLTRIGGRTAVIQPDEEGPDTCRVVVVHRSYIQDGETAVETLNLTVGGDPSEERLRQLATRLAGAAVSHVRAG
ncbi:serine/threonine-protein kinase [Streptomyces pseudoechinosporeus]